jgi:hypothetical protein
VRLDIPRKRHLQQLIHLLRRTGGVSDDC